MNQSRQALRLNVGFLINQSVGFSREFHFDFSKLFFESDLELNHFIGTARITRTTQGLLVQSKMKATVPAQCVRCLTDLQQLLEIEFAELYAFSSRSIGESVLILPDNGHIDLNPLVREYMLLEIPINPLCRPDCRGLCPVCGERITDIPHNHDEDLMDPRLAQLKTLLEDKNQGQADHSA